MDPIAIAIDRCYILLVHQVRGVRDFDTLCNRQQLFEAVGHAKVQRGTVLSSHEHGQRSL